MNIPTILLAQLQTYLQHATETQQDTKTQKTSETQQTNTPDTRYQPHSRSPIVRCIGNNQDLPPVIANVPPPPQLSPQQSINPPHPGISTHHPLSIESTASTCTTTYVFWIRSGKMSILILVHLPVRQCMAHHCHRPHLPLK